MASSQPASSLVSAAQASEQKNNSLDQTSAKQSAEVNIDSAEGQPYVIYEGLTMDTVLMNRLDGDAVGPVKVLVSSPVYSHDRQHVSSQMEPSCWVRRARSALADSASNAGWRSSSTA